MDLAYVDDWSDLAGLLLVHRDTCEIHRDGLFPLKPSLNGLEVGYLKESERLPNLFLLHHLRSLGEDLLQVPTLTEARMVGTRETAFSIAIAPQFQNSLSRQVRLAPTLAVWRKNLKAELCRRAFATIP